MRPGGWLPNPIGLVSLEVQEERPWQVCKDTRPSASPQGEASGATIPAGTLTLASSLQSREKMVCVV